MNLVDELAATEDRLAQRLQELIKADAVYAYFSGRKELLLTLLKEQDSNEQQGVGRDA